MDEGLAEVAVQRAAQEREVLRVERLVEAQRCDGLCALGLVGLPIA